MTDTVTVDTEALRSTVRKYQDIHSDMAVASIQQPAGFDRSTAAASDAAGNVGAAISAVVEAVGELGERLWEVAQYYEDVDACVVHDFDAVGK
ncbi:MAG: hypothetical protein L0H81_05790 [Actinomyces sp.]|nr:hypothetical protein [Actinomyces sp.]